MPFIDRKPRKILAALREPRHWRALINMARLYPRFPDNLHRYLTHQGAYPYDCRIRTPLGEIAPTLYTFHDLLTVNEIFCRRDYGQRCDAQTIVDIGSNIGISALFFLTRNETAFCYLFEPDPRNNCKLRRNLEGLNTRYKLSECAVANIEGEVELGIEGTGRYGGIDVRRGTTIPVQCLHINTVLEQCISDAGHIDVLKIDTEGAELRTVRAIDPTLLEHVDSIYLESHKSPALPGFKEAVYGSVRQLTRRRHR